MACSAASPRQHFFSWPRFALFALTLAAGPAGRAVLPDYLRTALARFNPEMPSHWAYTTATTRGEVSTTERYDPGQPDSGQWVLLLYNGRAPTAEETAKYLKLRAANPEPSTIATFQRGDIDPQSLRLLHEDAGHAEFLATFREEAGGADKMLRHLELRLSVAKGTPHVEKFTLTLREPYNPIFGVKMKELVATMRFSPPAADRPSLPVECTSHFIGRIFFIGTEENLRVVYSDFSPADKPRRPE